MLFSGRVVERQYDKEEASNFDEEDMEENQGIELDRGQVFSVCDDDFPIFDQDEGQDYDQDVAIFDDDSEALAYKEVDVCEYEDVAIFDDNNEALAYEEVEDCEYEEEVDVCEYKGVPIFDNYGDEDDLLVESVGTLDEESFVDETSFALALFPMKEVVAIPPFIPLLDSKKIMVESPDIEVSWMLNGFCFQEMPLMLSLKPFVPLCVSLVPNPTSWRKDAFILGPCKKHYFDDILLSKRHATQVAYSHLNMASVDVHKRKLVFMERYLPG